MPSTVIVNLLSVVHASSSGIAPSFPDVCKTPAPPAPFVPVPYPNIAKSSDTSMGSSTVKMDGNPIMLKSSIFMQSTGDEAGSAGGGIMSNTIKGKAEFTMYSFDVKADGENVPRLTDPMQTNKLNPANSFNPAEIQATMVGVAKGDQPRIDACERTLEVARDQPQSNEPAQLAEAGIVEKHHNAILTVATDLSVVLYFRHTNQKCKPWINDGHQPKPHSLIDGSTIDGDTMITNVADWLYVYHLWNERQERGVLGAISAIEKPPYYPLPENARTLEGVQMRTLDDNDGEPAKAIKLKFWGKWITGDYDLFDVQEAGDTCDRPDSNNERNPRWGQIMNALNKKMGWPGIQHPCQSQWKKTKKENVDFDMPTILREWLREETYSQPPMLDVPNRKKPLPSVGAPVTVVSPSFVMKLETVNEVRDALICAGCRR